MGGSGTVQPGQGGSSLFKSPGSGVVAAVLRQGAAGSKQTHPPPHSPPPHATQAIKRGSVLAPSPYTAQPFLPRPAPAPHAQAARHGGTRGEPPGSASKVRVAWVRSRLAVYVDEGGHVYHLFHTYTL